MKTLLKAFVFLLGLVFTSATVGYAAYPRHIVEWQGVGFDHKGEIEDRFIDAMGPNGGVVEFEAGRIYECSGVNLNPNMWTGSGDPPNMPAGIEGNGATLRITSTSNSAFYMWSPHHSSNTNFYLRDLTLDANLKSQYGLRIWGAHGIRVENVRAKNAISAGVYLQSTPGTYSLQDCLFRQVFSSDNTGLGFRINGNTIASSDFASAIALDFENCYAHRNGSDGMFLTRAEADIVGFGAEGNTGYSIRLGSLTESVSNVNILGGYAERNYPKHPIDPFPDMHYSVFMQPGKVKDIRVLGGRQIGKFTYDSDDIDKSIVHSFGHQKFGFNGQSPQDSRNDLYDYKSVRQEYQLPPGQQTAQEEIAVHFTDGTSAVDLKTDRNIILVEHDPTISDYTCAINKAIHDAGPSWIGA